MKIAAVIPHYRHTETLFAVAEGARRHLELVLVVDDGTPDLPADTEAELASLGVKFLRHERNRGKGAALLTAAKALDGVADSMVTLDADGQHDPDDLPKFISALRDCPDAVVVGCRDFEHAANVPGSSRFGRKFSNFWCRLETGTACGDTQSGFRAYPVRGLNALRFFCRRYNFEIEALVKLLWSGYELREVPVAVTYAPPGRRISHFDPWKDNLRLSLLHTALVVRRLLPWPFRKLVRRPRPVSLWRHPKRFFAELLRENADPAGLAMAAGVGTFLAVLPLVGVHMAVILYVCIRFKLNKAMALAIQNLFMPPLSPFLCIELGFFLRHGRFWTDFTMHRCLHELHFRVYEWLLGSLILAPLFALLVGGLTFCAASWIKRRSEKERGAEERKPLQ